LLKLKADEKIYQGHPKYGDFLFRGKIFENNTGIQQKDTFSRCLLNDK